MMEFEIPQNPPPIPVIVEMCGLCSAYYEKPKRSYVQPFVNRLICKVLEVEPPRLVDGSSYFNHYIEVCDDCTTRLKTYDKKRIELDILRKEIVSAVLDTILHIRTDDKSPLHPLRHPILERWARECLPPEYELNVKNSTVPSAAAEKELKEPNNSIIPASPRRRPTEANHSKRIAGVVGQRQQISTNLSKIQSPKSTEKTQTSKTFIEKAVESVLPDRPADTEVNTDSISPNSTVWQIGSEVQIPSTVDSSQLADATNNYIAENIQIVGDINSDDDNDDRGDSGGDDTGGMEEPEISAAAAVHKKKRTIARPKRKRTNDGGPKSKRIRKAQPARARAPQHRKPPYFCESCGRVFSKLATLLRHVEENVCKKDQEDVVLECSICKENFSNLTWLAVKFHVDEKHENVKLDYCRLCKREFMPNTIVWHKCDGFEAMPKNEFPCDYCDKLYHNVGSLSKHMYRKHLSSADEKPFKCEICNRTFVSNSVLVVHKEGHKNSDVFFACEHCGIKCPSKGSLREHTKIHTSDRRFQCTVCGKRFRYKTLLNIHTVVHTNEKNHTCDICEKSFKTQATMIRHWKRHMNPVQRKRELCPICKSGIAYVKTKTLKEHMSRKHPGTPEQVEICARPDDPEEDLMFSQSKIPTPRARPTKRTSNESNPEQQVSESEYDDEKDFPNCSDDETESPLEMESDNANRVKQESTSGNTSRTLSMRTRRGGKRVVKSAKQVEKSANENPVRKNEVILAPW